jgi:hypothetical protein
MRGAIPPIPNTPSWGGAQLKGKKAQGKIYLYLLPLILIYFGNVACFEL